MPKVLAEIVDKLKESPGVAIILYHKKEPQELIVINEGNGLPPQQKILTYKGLRLKVSFYNYIHVLHRLFQIDSRPLIQDILSADLLYNKGDLFTLLKPAASYALRQGPPPPPSKYFIPDYIKSLLEEMELQLKDDPVNAAFLINLVIFQTVKGYFHLNRIGKPKLNEEIPFIEKEAPAFYKRLEKIFSEMDLTERYRLLKEMVTYILASHGGLAPDSFLEHM
jgi:hypothetical protein